MTTIDHAAEARKHLEWVHEWQSYTGDTPETGLADALVAQVHATLALVEQQRIANVLAYLDHAEGDEYERLHDDIKKALELS